MDENYEFYYNDSLSDLFQQSWQTRFPLKDMKRTAEVNLLLKNSKLDRSIIVNSHTSESSGWEKAPVSSFTIILEDNEDISLDFPDGLDENMTYEDVILRHKDINYVNSGMTVYGYLQQVVFRQDINDNFYEVNLVFYNDKLYSVKIG